MTDPEVSFGEGQGIGSVFAVELQFLMFKFPFSKVVSRQLYQVKTVRMVCGRSGPDIHHAQ